MNDHQHALKESIEHKQTSLLVSSSDCYLDLTNSTNLQIVRRQCCLNKGRIPDGDVNAFHHRIYYLAITEFERESFLGSQEIHETHETKETYET